MAEPSDPDSSDSVDLKPPIFSLPGFFVGFGTKRTTPDSDSPGRSPTSPLDFSVFGGLFSPRKESSSPRSPNRNKWLSHKVGLSVLTDCIGLGDDDDDECLIGSLPRDNIVLAPQIKVNVSSTPTQLFGPSNSLPKNYTSAVEEPTSTSPRRSSSSSPMDIIPSQAYSRSLSGREMALSEDYTCIISHGPNPKTTHIFGDCILDCDPKDLEDIEKPTEGNDDSLPTTVDSFSLCSHDFQDTHIHRSGANLINNREVVAAGKESEGVCVTDSLDKEDLFPMAMHAS